MTKPRHASPSTHKPPLTLPLHPSTSSPPPSFSPSKPRPSSSSSSSLTLSAWQSLQRERAQLPIHASRERIINAVKQHSTIVLVGETGSGQRPPSPNSSLPPLCLSRSHLPCFPLPSPSFRQNHSSALPSHPTTPPLPPSRSCSLTPLSSPCIPPEIPQYLHEAGFTSTGLIACTQPRRVAAVSVAARVALETSPAPSTSSPSSSPTSPPLVSYSIRFDDTTTPHTLIKYITDGMLLREALSSPLLPSYSVVLLDEAHERSVNTDLLCYVLSTIQQQRPLKLIIMSATLNPSTFTSYFHPTPPLLQIEGRQYPVDVLYTVQAQDDYVDAAVTAALQIHTLEDTGDVLIFLPGQEDIEAALLLLQEKLLLLPSPVPPFLPLPLYAALSHDQQLAIFQPSPHRKLILSTNIAETSLTLPGVRYVIDSGLAKVKTSHPSLPLSLLTTQEISQAEAWQRSGRAGRERPGRAYRLYTEAAFERFKGEREAEVKTAELSSVMLQLKGMGVKDVMGVRWLTPPRKESVRWALERLLGLGALDLEGGLTGDGKSMVGLPVDVADARALLMSAKPEWGCSEEVVTIISMLTVGNIFSSQPRGGGGGGGGAPRKLWTSDEGDHLLLLRVYRDWCRHRTSAHWCDEWRVQRRSLAKVDQVRTQLSALLSHLGLPLISCTSDDQVRKCLAFAYHLRIARRDPTAGVGAGAGGSYVTLWDGQRVSVHPSSVLMGAGCEYVCYHELVWTKRKYMRDCVRVEAEWVREMREKEGGESGGQATAPATSAQGRGVVTERVIQRLAGSDGSAAKREKEKAESGAPAFIKRPKVIINFPSRKGG